MARILNNLRCFQASTAAGNLWKSCEGKSLSFQKLDGSHLKRRGNLSSRCKSVGCHIERSPHSFPPSRNHRLWLKNQLLSQYILFQQPALPDSRNNFSGRTVIIPEHDLGSRRNTRQPRALVRPVSLKLSQNCSAEKYFRLVMADEITSAEDLFDLLAADGNEVPSILIKGGKDKSAHKRAILEQAKLSRLNKVEKWIKSEKAIIADPKEFIGVGETLFLTLCKSGQTELTDSVVDKLRRLCRLWLEVSKSCKLLEPYIDSEFVVRLMNAVLRAKSLHLKVQETCGRMLVGLVQCSPDRLFSDVQVIEAFNTFIAAWCKGKYRGNGFNLLNLFPVEFLSQLDWVGSSRAFALRQQLELVVRIMKKGLPVKVDQSELLRYTGSKEIDEIVLKFGGSLVRAKLQVSEEFAGWVRQVSEYDAKQSGVSGKNVQLAKQLVKNLAM